MATEETPDEKKRKPISDRKRKQLQKVFQTGNAAAMKNNHDYAVDMFATCVKGDPGNVPYMQSFMGALYKKYGNNKKGAKLAGMKTAKTKRTVSSCNKKEDDDGLISAAIEVLKINPWDVETLKAMSDATERMGYDDAEVTCLKFALNLDPEDDKCNEKLANTFERLGYFDDAIKCWEKVQKVRPDDEVPRRKMSALSVQNTIHKGGYEEAQTTQEVKVKTRRGNVRDQDREEREAAERNFTPEERLQRAIKKEPHEVSNYLKLSQLYRKDQRFADEGDILKKALEIEGQDPTIQERYEEAELSRLNANIVIARKQFNEEKTPESKDRLRSVMIKHRKYKIDVYRNRVDRYPTNTMFKFELASTMEELGQVKEAITIYQETLQGEITNKGPSYLALGRCFEKIKQYKLAVGQYKLALENLKSDPDLRKDTLYLVGCLAMDKLQDEDMASNYFNELAAVDFGYKDVSDRLEKLGGMDDNL